jgi:hypothetical protein
MSTRCVASATAKDSFIVIATGAELWLGVQPARPARRELAWPRALLAGATAVSFVLNVATPRPATGQPAGSPRSHPRRWCSAGAAGDDRPHRYGIIARTGRNDALTDIAAAVAPSPSPACSTCT